MGHGLARPVDWAVLHGPARHEKRPIGPCLGLRPSTKPAAARPVRPVGPMPFGPCQPDIVPGRAGPAHWPSIISAIQLF